MKSLLLVILTCVAATVSASGLRSAREREEAGMIVTGTIQVTPQGTVMGYSLDRPEKLPVAASEAVGQTLPKWTFKPVVRNGKPVAAEAKMSLRLVAQPVGEGRYRVSVHGAYFGESDPLAVAAAPRVRYPPEAVAKRIGAIVYLALRVDRAGRVQDTVAEQVNLRVIADERTSQRLREAFAAATEESFRSLRFAPADPTDPAPYRILREPVVYSVEGGWFDREAYGQWQTYIPGPQRPVPWLDDKLLAGNADALPGDGFYGPSVLTLLTPLQEGDMPD